MSDNFLADNSEATRDRASLIKILSIVSALAITAAIFIGYLIWRKWHEEKTVSTKQSQTETVQPVAATLPAKVQVSMDEPVRQGPHALINGTVRNISSENIPNLIVEIELSHRKDTGTEIRSLEVEPKELAPNQDGKYALTLDGDYRGVKLLRVKAGARSELIGFKTAPGAKRPIERPTEAKTIIINRPSAPAKGEEFINSPDNPAKIP